MVYLRVRWRKSVRPGKCELKDVTTLTEVEDAIDKKGTGTKRMVGILISSRITSVILNIPLPYYVHPCNWQYFPPGRCYEYFQRNDDVSE